MHFVLSPPLISVQPGYPCVPELSMSASCTSVVSLFTSDLSPKPQKFAEFEGRAARVSGSQLTLLRAICNQERTSVSGQRPQPPVLRRDGSLVLPHASLKAPQGKESQWPSSIMYPILAFLPPLPQWHSLTLFSGDLTIFSILIAWSYIYHFFE